MIDGKSEDLSSGYVIETMKAQGFSGKVIDFFSLFLHPTPYVNRIYDHHVQNQEYQNALSERLTDRYYPSEPIPIDIFEQCEWIWSDFNLTRQEFFKRVGSVSVGRQKFEDRAALVKLAEDVSGYVTLFDGKIAKEVIDANNPDLHRLEFVDPEIISCVNFVLISTIKKLDNQIPELQSTA